MLFNTDLHLIVSQVLTISETADYYHCKTVKENQANAKNCICSHTAEYKDKRKQDITVIKIIMINQVIRKMISIISVF